MKRLYLSTVVLIVVLALSACGGTPSPAPTEATALPEPPTLAPTEPALATAEPTAVDLESAETPTELPPTEAPTATAEPPTAEPTAEPAATNTPAPTEEPTMTPITESVMAPGQRDTAELDEGAFQTYLVDMQQFRPNIFFVEPSRDLDVELLAFIGQLEPGAGLDSATPDVTADNALAGRPEIVVLSPDAAGLNTFVVRAAAGSGEYTAYLFDLASPATGMAVQQSDTIGVGETKSYEVTSIGARPVIAMADPTNLSDVVLDILAADGSLLTTANFSGPGGAEVAYVLPIGVTDYTIVVREVNGMPSTFEVAVVTLE